MQPTTKPPPTSRIEARIEQQKIIGLSVDDQKRFAEALVSPPPLAPAMKGALQAHKRLIKSK